MNFEKQDFYGDRSRWFIAKVVNNRDPDLMNRVQIRIRGIHSDSQIDIPQSGLPWAYTALPTTEGGTSGIGRISQIQPNAIVYGIFLDGQTSQLPLVLGVLSQFERPTRVQQQAAARQGIPITPGSNVVEDGTVIPEDTDNGDTFNNRQGGDDGTGGASLSEKRFRAMRFFVSNGLSLEQAAGIVGNFEAESGLSTSIVSNITDSQGRRTTERSQGLAQWNPAVGRLQNLYRFADSQNVPWYNFDLQLRFTLHEMRTNNYFNRIVWSRLQECDRYRGGSYNETSRNSTWIILRYYENPASPRTKISTRENLAANAYNEFVSGTS